MRRDSHLCHKGPSLSAAPWPHCQRGPDLCSELSSTGLLSGPMVLATLIMSTFPFRLSLCSSESTRASSVRPYTTKEGGTGIEICAVTERVGSFGRWMMDGWMDEYQTDRRMDDRNFEGNCDTRVSQAESLQSCLSTLPVSSVRRQEPAWPRSLPQISCCYTAACSSVASPSWSFQVSALSPGQPLSLCSLHCICGWLSGQTLTLFTGRCWPWCLSEWQARAAAG